MSHFSSLFDYNHDKINEILNGCVRSEECEDK